MPFAGYEDWDACIADQTQNHDNSQEAAEHICGALQAEAEGKAMRRVIDQKLEVEKRDDGGRTIRGYAAVFYREGEPGTEFELLDGFYERIDPRAFDRALAEGQEVRALFNHDPNQLLGRAPKTLRLKVDDTGLRYEIDLPDTTIGRDVATHIDREDIQGSSFSFQPKSLRYDKDEEENREIRTVMDVDLFDVGPVTFPAYEATSAQMRSAEEADRQRRQQINQTRSRMQSRLPELTKLTQSS